MTEATALLRLQHGKEDALAWFIDKYTPYVCTVIRYIIGSSMTEEDVEETASDVFLVLWEQAEQVCLSTVRPWLGGVARNKARQKLRQRGLTLPLEEDLLLCDGTDLEQALSRRSGIGWFGRRSAPWSPRIGRSSCAATTMASRWR